MTLVYVVLSIVPIVQVESRLAFALKISAIVIVANAIGLATYRTGRSRSSSGARAPHSAA